MQLNKLSNADFDKMIIESIDEVYCFDKESDALLFYFDQVREGEITSESDVVYAEGRQGVQLAAFDRNKTAGFTCENGYVQAGALAVQLGSNLATGETEFEVMEEVTGNASDKLILENPINQDSNDAYIVKIYNRNKDGSAGAEVTTYTASNVGDEAMTSAVAYDTETAGIAKDTIVYVTDNGTTTYYKVTSAIAQGTAFNNASASLEVYNGTTHGEIVVTDSENKEYIVCYTSTTATGKTIINSGDQFSKNIKLVINFVAQEPCGGNKYLMQCVMPNAKASGSFSLSVGNDPAVHNFEATALYDVCSKNGELFTIKMV